MTLNQINQIIRDYMGEDSWHFIPESYPDKTQYDYDESIDALVPVWERLEEKVDLVNLDPVTKEVTILNKEGFLMKSVQYDTLAESAAAATAMIIKELK